MCQADAIHGQRYAVEIAPLSPETTSRLAEVLGHRQLAGLVEPRNPLDLTPMADEQVYEQAVRALLEADEVEAVVVGIVPLTSALKTTAVELEAPDSLARRLPALFARSDKPLVAVIDSGALYDPLARALRLGGVPVLRSADQAIRSLGRYLCHRSDSARERSLNP